MTDASVPVKGADAITYPIDNNAVTTGAGAVYRQRVEVANLPSTQPVSGTVAVSNLPATQAVSGTVTVSNPTAQGLTDTQLRATPVPVSGTVTITDGSGPVTVDGTVSVGNFPATQAVGGDAANAATDVGNPVKVGGRYSAATPTPVTDGQRVNAWFDAFGRVNSALHSAELNSSIAHTSLRDLQIAQRYTVLADSVADGLASFWTSSVTGSGVAPVVSSGEGVLASSATANSSSQLTSTLVRYFPGQSAWLNSAVRFGDTGVVGNTRRIGVFTVSGTAPQDGFYFELADTTLNAVVIKNGVVQSSVASTAWSRFAQSPFTLDANYHQFEIRFTSNGCQFYVDNVVRHVFAGTNAAITNTLNFPMTLQTVNTTATANCVIAVRNIGMGRFGQQPQDYSSGQVLADQAGAGAVLTFTFATPVDFIWVTDTGATTTNISRVDPFGGTPSASQGIPVFNATPTPIQVVPPASNIKVYAPAGASVAMHGLRYI